MVPEVAFDERERIAKVPHVSVSNGIEEVSNVACTETEWIEKILLNEDGASIGEVPMVLRQDTVKQIAEQFFMPSWGTLFGDIQERVKQQLGDPGSISFLLVAGLPFYWRSRPRWPRGARCYFPPCLRKQL